MWAWPAVSKWVSGWLSGEFIWVSEKYLLTEPRDKQASYSSLGLKAVGYHSTPIALTFCLNMGVATIRQKLLCILLSATLLTTPLGAWAADGLPELGESSGADLSLLTEKKIGRRIMSDIRWNEPSYLDDPEVEAYLNNIGGRLAAASPDPSIGFTFFAMNDRMINAFATFGGYIGVNTGLLLSVQNESELAGVLAHEVSHVTQRHLARQISQGKATSMAMLAAMAAAILASRGSSQGAMAGVVGAQAGAIQSQLGFSRDFEREADRIGLQTLEKAGFDPRGMSGFFERLQKATRIYENNAPVYLRTHPLNTERISDMQNREQQLPYRQVLDGLAFHLVRAKLSAQQGTPKEGIKAIERRLQETPANQQGAWTYGLAVAHFRAKHWALAEQALQQARALKTHHSMLDRLDAEIRLAKGDVSGGLKAYRTAMANDPLNLALIYGYAEALLKFDRPSEAVALMERRVKQDATDANGWRLLAKSAAALNLKSLAHRAQGEFYALQAKTAAAIEQLQLAQQAGDANFYELSAIDARLRELMRQRQEERADGPNRF